MQKKPEAYHVFNGTDTAVWINSERHYEINSIQAKVTYSKEDIDFCGGFYTQSITTGAKGTGSIGIYKTDSSNLSFFDEEHPNQQSEIIFRVDSPDAVGAERIRLTGVMFDDTTLADYTAKKAGQVTIAFTFTGWETLETAAATI